jgi:hypothetical protein
MIVDPERPGPKTDFNVNYSLSFRHRVEKAVILQHSLVLRMMFRFKFSNQFVELVIERFVLCIVLNK